MPPCACCGWVYTQQTLSLDSSFSRSSSATRAFFHSAALVMALVEEEDEEPLLLPAPAPPPAPPAAASAAAAASSTAQQREDQCCFFVIIQAARMGLTSIPPSGDFLLRVAELIIFVVSFRSGVSLTSNCVGSVYLVYSRICCVARASHVDFFGSF